jgi:FAD/FMN-containing dehydrogenase
MTHGLDGFSLALDFPIARHSRGRIVEMTAEIDALICSLGGRFYPAKDATLKASHYRLSMPVESMDRFVSLKRTLDPENRLESDLYRRLFEDGPHNSGILKAAGK